MRSYGLPTKLVHRDDVRVLELTGDLCFAQKAAHCTRIAVEPGTQFLQGDVSIEVVVACHPDEAAGPFCVKLALLMARPLRLVGHRIDANLSGPYDPLHAIYRIKTQLT